MKRNWIVLDLDETLVTTMIVPGNEKPPEGSMALTQGSISREKCDAMFNLFHHTSESRYDTVHPCLIARPGLSRFMREISRHFHICLLSTRSLDELSSISAYFFPRGDVAVDLLISGEMLPAAQDGHHKRRDLEVAGCYGLTEINVIVIDDSPDSVYYGQKSLGTTNAIKVSPFDGYHDDDELSLVLRGLKKSQAASADDVRRSVTKFCYIWQRKWR